MSNTLRKWVKKWKEGGAGSAAGAVMLDAVKNGITDGVTQAVILRLVGFLIVVAVLYAIAWWWTRPYKVHMRLRQQADVPRCKAVVTPLSPLNRDGKNLDVITNLVQHHAKQLRRLVLVCTPADEGVQNALNALKRWLAETYPADAELQPDTLLTLVPVDNVDDIAEIYARAVRKIEELPYAAKEIDVDVTAGLKTFSLALMLAAQDSGCLLSYQVSERNEQGRPVEGTARLTLLKLDEVLARKSLSPAS